MSERAIRREMSKQESAERLAAQDVCRLIRQGASVCWFFEELFKLSGADKSPFSTDPLQMAHDAGMITLLSNLLAPLEIADPGIRGYVQEQIRTKHDVQNARLNRHLSDDEPG